MITVRDIMTTPVITVTPDMNIAGAAKILLDNRVNGAPVVDDKGRLVGILCQSDLIAQQKKAADPDAFHFSRQRHPVELYQADRKADP